MLQQLTPACSENPAAVATSGPVISVVPWQRELLALQIMGHSPWRLGRTSFALGGFYSIVAILVSFWVGPVGFKGFEQSMAEAKKLSVASTLLSGTFSEDFLDMTFFAETVNPNSGSMTKVFLQDSSSYDKKISISAKNGDWNPDQKNGLSELRLSDGIIIAVQPGSDIMQRIRFDQYEYFIDFQSTEVRGKSSLQSLSLSELMAKKHQYAKDRKNPQRIILELGRRFYVSLLCLLFAPLAFGLSLDHRRTAKSRSLAYGIAITLAYYLLHFWLFTYLSKQRVAWLGGHESWTWMLMAIPTLLTLGAGIWSFRKTFAVPRG